MMSSAVSSHKKALLLSPTYAQVDSVLSVLDDAIAHKSEYQKRRIAHIDSIVKTATQKKGRERIAALKDAYSSCSNVSGEKSMDILDQIAKQPEYDTDRDLRLWVLDSRGYTYSVMGMYHRSYALLHGVKVDDYSRPARMYHYDTMYRILSWANDAFCKGSSLTPEEKATKKQYNDSLQGYNHDATSIVFAKVTKDITEHNYDDALNKLAILYQGTTGQEETYVYANLCDVFAGKKDYPALTYYLALTSISDIKDGTTEYMCLPALVQRLFEDGDVDRAYNYLKCCLEDAYLYPSQYLISQTTNIFPIIDKQYQQKKRDYDYSQRNMMIMGFCAFLLFFALLILSVFLHHRRHMMKELKDANDKLAETNTDLAQANNIKNIFLKNMSHELHTPMNAIDGFAQLLDMNDGLIDSTTRKSMTSAIRTSSHQLNMLIDNIILLTEYENIHVETHKERVDVNSIFETLKVDVFYPKTHSLDIVYNNNIPDDFVFVSSSSHITTILKNLVDNALKFTEEGRVAVTADVNDKHWVTFRVSDTGIGIPEEKRAVIFERFSKLDKFAQGVGLGLPLCHKLTTMLGGKICIEKSDNNGTTITVTIPSIS